MPVNEKQATIAHLENVVEAMNGLLDHWLTVDDNEDKELCADYPLEQSFDDILAEFVYWKDQYIQKKSVTEGVKC